MKKSFAVMLMGLLLSAPAGARAAEFVGSVQGYNCVTSGKVCPVGKEDPMAQAENVFVLLVDAAKGEYYFLPNVERDVLVRHLNEQIIVSGDLDKEYKAIRAKDVFITKGKIRDKVWSINKRDPIYRAIYGPEG